MSFHPQTQTLFPLMTLVVWGESVGSADIKAKIIDTDVFFICKVNVLPISVTGINISVNGLDLNGPFIRTTVLAGKKIVITPTVQPLNATNKDISFTSSNTDVAEVKLMDGIYYIVTREKGFSIIKATTTDGNYVATCEVTAADIDKFATIELSVKTVFDSYGQNNFLKIEFDTNVSENVLINSLHVYDNFGKEPFDFASLPLNKQNIVIDNLPINAMNINGWKAKINYTWNGKDYTTTSK